MFASVTAQLANLSFTKGSFPIQFKIAQVTPIIKKAGLDTSNLASYTPISKLNTISKVLERLFLARLISHISPFICSLQSAYHQLHSILTPLLKIVSDMLEAAESGCVIVLVATCWQPSTPSTTRYLSGVSSTCSASKNRPSVG